MAKTGADPNPLSRVLWAALTITRKWGTVVDVGANYGEMLASVELSHVGRIVAFEPASRVRSLLEQTCVGLPWSVEVRGEAVGGERGTATFWEDTSWSGRSGIQARDALILRGHDYSQSEVQTVALDEFLSGEGSVCVKIDVEGSELDVLAGCAELVRSQRNWSMMIELLQLNPADIGYLARRYQLLVLDLDSGRFEQVDGSTIRATTNSLYAGRRYFQDGILLPKHDSSTRLKLDAAINDMDRERDHLLGGAVSAVVYTALLGRYENLLEQPMAAESDVSFICFTDDPNLTSETWDVRLVAPHFPHDPVRSARRLKALGHPDLARFETSIWIDNRVILKARPLELVGLLQSNDIAAFEHSFRSTVREEFAAVLSGGYDDPTRIGQQLLAYETDKGCLDEKPIWTGLLVRRRTDRLNAAMQDWFEQITLHSRRDQLSILRSLATSSAKLKRLKGDNRESRLHEWVPRRDARLGRLTSPLLGAPAHDTSPDQHDARTLLEGLSRAYQLSTERSSAELDAMGHKIIRALDQGNVHAKKQEQLARASEKRARQFETQARQYRHRLRDVESSRTFRTARALQRLSGIFRRRSRTT